MANTFKVISSASVLLILAISITTSMAFWNGWRNRFKPRIPTMPRIRIRTPRPTRKPTPAPTNPPAFAPVKDSKYCDESNLQKILSGTGREKRASLSWPYKCTFASIVKNKGAYQYMHDIYTCCEKCEHPTFTRCVGARKRHNEWKCPSDGLHCVVECVKKYGPGTELVTIAEPGVGGILDLGHGQGGKIPQIREIPKKLDCGEKEETRPDGKSKCIRRLCIHLKL